MMPEAGFRSPRPVRRTATGARSSTPPPHPRRHSPAPQFAGAADGPDRKNKTPMGTPGASDRSSQWSAALLGVPRQRAASRFGVTRPSGGCAEEALRSLDLDSPQFPVHPVCAADGGGRRGGGRPGHLRTSLHRRRSYPARLRAQSLSGLTARGGARPSVARRRECPRSTTWSPCPNACGPSREGAG